MYTTSGGTRTGPDAISGDPSRHTEHNEAVFRRTEPSYLNGADDQRLLRLCILQSLIRGKVDLTQVSSAQSSGVCTNLRLVLITATSSSSRGRSCERCQDSPLFLLLGRRYCGSDGFRQRRLASRNVSGTPTATSSESKPKGLQSETTQVELDQYVEMNFESKWTSCPTGATRCSLPLG